MRLPIEPQNFGGATECLCAATFSGLLESIALTEDECSWSLPVYDGVMIPMFAFDPTN